MTTVKFKLIENGKIPTKANEHAACYDVYARTMKQIPNDIFKIEIALGFATEIPENWKGVIVPRSNITKCNWFINNSAAQIDSDYRGEWKIVFTAVDTNIFPSVFPYSVGDRVAQIYFEPVYDVEMEVVDTLSETQRGEGGFGHTGLK